MDPIEFVYCFIIEGYNVFVTIEFFPHVIIMEDYLSMGPFDNDFRDVDTLFNGMSSFKKYLLFQVISAEGFDLELNVGLSSDNEIRSYIRANDFGYL